MKTFSKKTFDYFALAKRNRNNRAWFEKNRALFEEHVYEPFTYLIDQIDAKMGKDLPRIDLLPRRISKPLVRANRVSEDSGVVRFHTHVSLHERQTSLFEWNPGIYLSLGADTDDNVLGIGMYMVSGRQIKRMRREVVDDYRAFHKIMSAPALKKRWGSLQGDLYKRFPKDFDEASPAAKYLWRKNFFLMKHPTKREVISKSFNENVVKDLQTALPFLKWIRNAVGVYKKSSMDW